MFVDFRAYAARAPRTSEQYSPFCWLISTTHSTLDLEQIQVDNHHRVIATEPLDTSPPCIAILVLNGDFILSRRKLPADKCPQVVGSPCRVELARR